MKRSAYTANSSLVETTNNNSPKRSCTQRNKLCVARYIFLDIIDKNFILFFFKNKQVIP